MTTLMFMEKSIEDASVILGVSKETIRRRLRNGVISGRKVSTPQGYRWLVSVPEPEDDHQDEPMTGGRANGNALVVEVLQDQVRQLTEQLESRTKEISELHMIIGARALNPGRSWWKLWRR